ncbi:MAG: hypothetical protein P0Y60_17915 [Candidatus Microbacterium colombiense]|nr:MAG: hypothetical protein P0Y60_17915 [Microbacterium sp.]
MSSTRSARIEIRWLRSSIALAGVNAATGAVFGYLYAFNSFGFDWSTADPDGRGGVLANSIAVSLVFGAIVPTGLSLLMLLWRRRRLEAWPVWVFLGPALCSLLSFLFVWSFPLVLAFIGIALVGGCLGLVAVKFFGGVRRSRGEAR